MSVNFLILAAILTTLGAGLATGFLHMGVSFFLFVVAGWIAALCLHEFGHAATAYAGGDRSVAKKGYLTLDPVRYTEPVTSIVLPLAIVAMGGIGFPGGAVYIDQGALRGSLWRAGVSLAGPAMTGVALLITGLPFALGLVAPETLFGQALALLAFLQATALLLNLLPIPGLDGFGVIEAFLPAAALRALAPLRSAAFFAFLIVIVAAPELLRPLFVAAFGLAGALGVTPSAVFDGLDAFRFWQ